MELYQEIAAAMRQVCDDEFVDYVQAACVTSGEWAADPEGCKQRVRGAMEEDLGSA